MQNTTTFVFFKQYNIISLLGMIIFVFFFGYALYGKDYLEIFPYY